MNPHTVTLLLLYYVTWYNDEANMGGLSLTSRILTVTSMSDWIVGSEANVAVTLSMITRVIS